MLHTRKRAVTLDLPSNGVDTGQPRVSIVQFMSHRYNALLDKLRSSSGSDANSQARVPINDKRVYSPSSGFRSPPPPPPGLGDGELYRLPAVESVPAFRKSGLSIGDSSEAIRGVQMRPWSLTGPPTGNDFQMSPVQRPSPIYDRDSQSVYLSSSF